MSKRYTLRDDGYEGFNKIYAGRKWLGRVVHDKVRGDYYARIGKTEARGATEREAFDKVVALHLGYASAAALRERNRQVRIANASVKDRARVLADRFSRGTFQEQMEIIDVVIGLPPKRQRADVG